MSDATWTIDPTHSGIHFSVRHMVVSKVRGKFADWKGTLSLEVDDPARSRVEAVIDAASIDTGVADRDTHLRSPDFLDVASYPEIVFRSTRVEKADEETYRLVGELSLHGVTREVTLDVEFGGLAKDPWGNERAGFTARARLDRKDFGLQWNQVLETGGVLVGDRIDVEIELEAVRAAATQVA